MDTNYRSSKSVVEQVNRWFEPNILNFPIARYRDGASEGFVEVRESEELVDEAIVALEFLLERGVDLSDIAFLVSTKSPNSLFEPNFEFVANDVAATRETLLNSL